MQKILRKRVLRDLKENLLRYFALGFLIWLSMYLVISIIGAADVIILGGERTRQEYSVEDGQFTLFVPLSKKEKKKLEKKGAVIQEEYNLDYRMKDGSILRVFQNRKKINRLFVEEGKVAKKSREVVLEKRYCEEHNLKVGDKVKIGEDTFKITGIGCSVDYESPLRKISDTMVDSFQFGLAFVTDDAYKELRKKGNSDKTEQFTYAYQLKKNLTDEKLKELLQDVKIDVEDANDSYLEEYWKEIGSEKKKLESGIQELTDGTKELKDGLGELAENGDKLDSGSKEIFNVQLREATNILRGYGLRTALTEENYEEVLSNLKNASGNVMLQMKLQAVIDQLKNAHKYKKGVNEYVEGVTKADDGAKELLSGVKELEDQTDEMLDKFFEDDISNLTEFITMEDNPRIGSSGDDQVINKMGGLIAGIIIMVLFTYVISVFVVHGIEKESSIIGVLYAMGVKRRELICHYLMLPVIVTSIASMIGTIIGFSPVGINAQMSSSYQYFSQPVFHGIYPPYLIIYGIFMPPLIAILVNWLVIRKKLSRPALQLIRNEKKQRKVSTVNLGNLGFVNRFRIRHMIREMRTSFTVIFGMFICLLIAMLGINCHLLCMNISKDNKADTKFEYMYTYKYPEKEVPENGEASFAKTFKRELFGYNFDVTLMGIDKENPYFDVDLKKDKNSVVLSSAAAQKFMLEIGDKIILTDEEENEDRVFTIRDITQYSTSFYAFMDIDSMRDLFEVDDDYYNVVFSDEKLNIPAGRLYSTISKDEIDRSSDVFVDLMKPMVYTMTIASMFIFCVVMYLMMKVMIDRSSFGISLIKIFGYRMSEIKKLYLNGNLIMIAIGAIVCIPLAKSVMDAMYPIMCSNVACGMDLEFSWYLYVGIYVAIIILYLFINHFLVKRLQKMVPAEVLKNRE